MEEKHKKPTILLARQESKEKFDPAPKPKDRLQKYASKGAVNITRQTGKLILHIA